MAEQKKKQPHVSGSWWLSTSTSTSSLHKYTPFSPSVSISIPSREECKQKLLPCRTTSMCVHKSEDWEEPCDDSIAIVSDITEMTYRAKLMWNSWAVTENDFFCVRIRTLFCTASITTSSVYIVPWPWWRHLRLSLRSSNRSKSRRVCAGTFQRNCNYSFGNTRSAQIKAEKRRSKLKLLEEEAEEDSIGDSTMQKQVDELFVEFGVRPTRRILWEPDLALIRTRTLF